MFQLLDKNLQKVIGGCGYHNWYALYSRAEIGYHILFDEYKNQGLMTEPMQTIIPYGFEQMRLNRIKACVAPNNLPSLRLMDKFNFQKEGYLRQHYFDGKDLYDSVTFSLLKEEYNKKV